MVEGHPAVSVGTEVLYLGPEAFKLGQDALHVSGW
jgi:hypothetical protein